MTRCAGWPWLTVSVSPVLCCEAADQAEAGLAGPHYSAGPANQRPAPHPRSQSEASSQCNPARPHLGIW